MFCFSNTPIPYVLVILKANILIVVSTKLTASIPGFFFFTWSIFWITVGYYGLDSIKWSLQPSRVHVEQWFTSTKSPIKFKISTMIDCQCEQKNNWMNWLNSNIACIPKKLLGHYYMLARYSTFKIKIKN